VVTLEKESTAAGPLVVRVTVAARKTCLVAKAGDNSYIMWTSLSSKHQLGLFFSSCVA
jgi:hypothetical protein